MSDVSTNEMTQYMDREAHDRDGDKIGKIVDVYIDDDTGQPEWLAVKTGTLGGRVSFVPMKGATVQGDSVMVAYDKATVKDAPNMEADGNLTPEDESRLYQHYGISGGTADIGGTTTDRGRDVVDTGGGPGYDTSGQGTDDAMTRSEEELQVGTRQREAGRARLRKWVETEQVRTTVPVERERAVLVTEPVDESNVDRAMSGPDLSDDEHEVVLHEEEVDVSKRVVPKERVRLDTETETTEVPVEEEVRRERVTLEGDADVDRPGGRS